MNIIWLAKKTKTDWGIFSKSEMLDSELMGIPKVTAENWISQGIAKIAPKMEVDAKQEWDDTEKKIKPIGG